MGLNRSHSNYHLKINEVVVNDDLLLCDYFNKHFSSSCNANLSCNTPFSCYKFSKYLSHSVVNSFVLFDCTNFEIMDFINNLNNSTSSGHDHISNFSL